MATEQGGLKASGYDDDDEGRSKDGPRAFGLPPFPSSLPSSLPPSPFVESGVTRRAFVCRSVLYSQPLTRSSVDRSRLSEIAASAPAIKASNRREIEPASRCKDRRDGTRRYRIQWKRAFHLRRSALAIGKTESKTTIDAGWTSCTTTSLCRGELFLYSRGESPVSADSGPGRFLGTDFLGKLSAAPIISDWRYRRRWQFRISPSRFN